MRLERINLALIGAMAPIMTVLIMPFHTTITLHLRGASLARKPNYNVEKRNRELQKKKKREDKLRSKRETQEADREHEARPELTEDDGARQES